ncbi:6-hydroxy-d-nicotine oxidase [Ceraceosorus bombacis]|uniref:6-hydroxy-d-nicotine oxidase n=1 Tax=Ceraceosorus bombacis TaxID=401625 RepID=A0A0P1BJW3_9BASI|nr:6-hydroxy-d-nicotine oxidase [Ceraceosorus bombacis]
MRGPYVTAAAAAAATLMASSAVSAMPLGFDDLSDPTSYLSPRSSISERRDVSSSLKTCLSKTGAQIDYPGSNAYNSESFSENSSIKPYQPAIIVTPANAQQAASALKCAANEGGKTKVVAKSGGHSYAGYSLGGQDGSLVISLSKLETLTVDKSAKTARVGAGNRLGPMAQALGEAGFALPHGTCPTVGTGGHSLGGGWGFSSRKWGWLLDHIVEMEVATLDGKVKKVNAQSTGDDADLWWALRGAGASNFGVVTTFTYALEDAPTNVINHSRTYANNKDCAQALLAFQDLGAKTVANGGLPAEFGAELLLYGEGSGSDGACTISGQYLSGPKHYQNASLILDNAISKRGVKPSKTSAPAFSGSQDGDNSAWLQALKNLMGDLQQAPAADPYYAKSLLDDGNVRFNPASAKAIIDKLQSYVGGEEGNSISFDLNGPASKTNAPLSSASAFDTNRGSLFFNQFYSYGVPGPDNPKGQQSLYTKFDILVDTVKNAAPNANWRAYSNYVDFRLKDWGRAYYGSSLDRLKSIKARLDPNSVFDYQQSLAHA